MGRRSTIKANTSFLHKQHSQIHGVGIFTSRKILKGESFYTVPLDTIVCFPIAKHAYIGDNIFVDDKEVLNWVNHSCDPNTIFEIKNRKPKLVAKKNIKQGDEITVDYELTEIGGQNKIKCTCSSLNCRGFFKIIA